MHKFFFYSLIVIFFRDQHALQIKSIYEVMNEYCDIEYIKYREAQSFHYDLFSSDVLLDLRPNKGILDEAFILRILNGEVIANFGLVKIGNTLIQESMYQDTKDGLYLQAFYYTLSKTVSRKIIGKVAVLGGYSDCYSHWMHDVLGKLIMLKEKNIEYDWLYVTCDKKYQKETLLRLGVDMQKIIEPRGLFDAIQADELIAPSLPVRRILIDNKSYEPQIFLAYYYADWVIDYLRKLFLPLSKKIDKKYSKKVFVSRKDALYRIIENEDEVFALFEKIGFRRYNLSELSVIEQVALFDQAEIIIGAHSSAFFNWIFCKPATKVIEIFQHRLDLSFFYIAQQMHLNYQCIKTVDFIPGKAGKSSNVPICIIKDFINKNLS